MAAEKEYLDAIKVRECMSTDGWKIIRQIFDEQIKSLDTVKGIATIRDLQGRLTALRALKTFLGQIDAITEAVSMGQSNVPKVPEDALYKIMRKEAL